jgi:hypothetical protein
MYLIMNKRHRVDIIGPFIVFDRIDFILMFSRNLVIMFDLFLGELSFAIRRMYSYICIGNK